MLESHNYNEDTQFDFTPFKFASPTTPTRFSIRFLMNGVEYVYGFSMTRYEILTEQLHYYPNGRKTLIFLRDENKSTEKKDKYAFRNSIKRPTDVIINTSRKTLFISRASQMDREIPKAIFNYFRENIVFDYYNTTPDTLTQVLSNEKTVLLNTLCISDGDIVDIKCRTEKNSAIITTFHKSNPAIPFDFLSEDAPPTTHTCSTPQQCAKTRFTL